MLFYMNYIMLLLLLMPSVLFADVYKWVDAAGEVHYSDRPLNDQVEKLDLPELTRYKPREIRKESEATTPAPGEAPLLDEKPTSYQRLAILSPEKEETIRDNEGRLLVRLVLEPTLHKDHYMKLSLDGVSMADKLKGNSAELVGLERGAHEIRVYVYNENNVQMNKSDAVKFFVRKTSILNKKTGAGGPSTQPVPTPARSQFRAQSGSN